MQNQEMNGLDKVAKDLENSCSELDRKITLLKNQAQCSWAKIYLVSYYDGDDTGRNIKELYSTKEQARLRFCDKKAYIETQNEYWYSEDYGWEEKYVDYSVFYEHVREKLEWTWVEIIDRPMNVYHKNLDYNYDNYVEIQQGRRPLPTT